MRVWRQVESVRKEGEESKHGRDAHGKEGDEEHVGRAAVVVHAPIITYPEEDARGISKKILAYRKVERKKARKRDSCSIGCTHIWNHVSYKTRDS